MATRICVTFQGKGRQAWYRVLKYYGNEFWTCTALLDRAPGRITWYSGFDLLCMTSARRVEYNVVHDRCSAPSSADEKPRTKTLPRRNDRKLRTTRLLCAEYREGVLSNLALLCPHRTVCDLATTVLLPVLSVLPEYSMSLYSSSTVLVEYSTRLYFCTAALIVRVQPVPRNTVFERIQSWFVARPNLWTRHSYKKKLKRAEQYGDLSGYVKRWVYHIERDEKSAHAFPTSIKTRVVHIETVIGSWIPLGTIWAFIYFPVLDDPTRPSMKPATCRS